MKLKDIEKLVRILENSIVSEIEITDILGRRVRISKSTDNNNVIASDNSTSAAQKKTADRKSTESKSNLKAIKSPIVGTFYRAPAPDAPPYVEVGDIVKPGQVICIVEAMKLMNEIESDITGKIAEVLVNDDEPVEYNQELFLVEPL